MKEKISTVISLIVAIIILSVSYFQWWDISYNGKMVFKKWLKVIFIFLIISLIIALLLIIF